MKILTGTQTLPKSRKRKKAPELVAEQEEADREKSDVSNESSDGSDDTETESSGEEEEEDLMIAALEELAEEEAESEGCIGRAETEAAEQAQADHRQVDNMADLLADASDINRISVCEALEQRFQEAQREPSMPSAAPSSLPSAMPSSPPSAAPSSQPADTEAIAEATEELHVDDAFRARNHSVRTRTNTTPNPWFKISDVEWGTALAEDVNWEFQWGTALEQRIEKYLQYDSEATATECTEQRTYYSSLVMQNCTTGASHASALVA